MLTPQTELCLWQRSRKGNLWRRVGVYTLTVFRRGEGFAFCLAVAEEPFYSEAEYDSEDEAAAAALAALEYVEEQQRGRGGKR